MRALNRCGVSEDEFDDLLRYDVGEPEEGSGDDDEAEHDGGRLADLAPVGPVHPLKLRPAGAKEVPEARAAPRARRRSGEVAGAITQALVADLVVRSRERRDRPGHHPVGPWSSQRAPEPSATAPRAPVPYR